MGNIDSNNTIGQALSNGESKIEQEKEYMPWYSKLGFALMSTPNPGDVSATSALASVHYSKGDTKEANNIQRLQDTKGTNAAITAISLPYSLYELNASLGFIRNIPNMLKARTFRPRSFFNRIVQVGIDKKSGKVTTIVKDPKEKVIGYTVTNGNIDDDLLISNMTNLTGHKVDGKWIANEKHVGEVLYDGLINGAKKIKKGIRSGDNLQMPNLTRSTWKHYETAGKATTIDHSGFDILNGPGQKVVRLNEPLWKHRTTYTISNKQGGKLPLYLHYYNYAK